MEHGMKMKVQSVSITLFTTPSTWVEGESIRQLERVAALPGMVNVAGFPDLHPGKGGPVGAAMLSEGIFYPYLVGSDVGCGMALFATDLSVAKAKPEKWAARLKGLEQPWDGDAASWLQERGAEPDNFTLSTGTIGMGNHFAELLRVREVADDEAFHTAALDRQQLSLLVHSGSRGLGERLLRSHVDKHRDEGLHIGWEGAELYLASHNNCLKWAAANRELIALRLLEQLGGDYRLVVDLAHNGISELSINGKANWLHRKGAAPSDQALVVIPGSRGACSYLVKPTGDQSANLWSVAHGAGRKWGRNECEGRLRGKYPADSMKKTKLGSYVICEDRNLLYEEAPQAYKDIGTVISDMVSSGLISVVAVFEPVLTYKVRSKQ
jgi:release factor H-coupled RctB family protein